MNSNQTVLEALAKEGVVTTEEALLRAVEDAHPIPALGPSTRGTASLDDLVIIARPPLEMDKVVGEPAADPAVEQRGRAMDEDAAAGALPGTTGEAQLVTRRGRQRTPKPWLMAALCRLGMHQGHWAFVAKGNCTQGRECGRCGSVHARTKHQRSWQYVGTKTCRQMKVCQRCGYSQGSRTDHESWSESWSVGSEREAHRCERCGVVQSWNTDCGD